jgi:hypothetical protein
MQRPFTVRFEIFLLSTWEFPCIMRSLEEKIYIQW